MANHRLVWDYFDNQSKAQSFIHSLQNFVWKTRELKSVCRTFYEVIHIYFKEMQGSLWPLHARGKCVFLNAYVKSAHAHWRC